MCIRDSDEPVLGAELKKLAGANTAGGTTSNAKQFTNYNAIRKSIVFEEGNAKTFLLSLIHIWAQALGIFCPKQEDLVRCGLTHTSV